MVLTRSQTRASQARLDLTKLSLSKLLNGLDGADLKKAEMIGQLLADRCNIHSVLELARIRMKLRSMDSDVGQMLREKFGDILLKPKLTSPIEGPIQPDEMTEFRLLIQENRLVYGETNRLVVVLLVYNLLKERRIVERSEQYHPRFAETVVRKFYRFIHNERPVVGQILEANFGDYMKQFIEKHPDWLSQPSTTMS